MKKHILFLTGMLAVALAFGLVLAGCEDATQSTGGGGGGPVPDTTAPTLVGSSISGNHKVVTLSFSEGLVNATAGDAALKEAVTFAANGTDFGALDGGDSVAINGASLVVTFSAALTTATNKIRVAAQALKDAAGNKTVEITTGAIDASATPVDEVIDIAAIAGVTAPATDDTPVTAITPTAQYTGTVTWAVTDGAAAGATFAANTAYTATITLSAKEGYTLTGVAANFFTVAGAIVGVTNAADTGVITAKFPATGAVRAVLYVGTSTTPEAGVSSLAGAITWLGTNATNNGDYTIELSADQTIAPTTLSYNSKTVTITLKGDTAVRAVSLSRTGSMFTLNSGVTLTLDTNVTLQGLSDNTASLVRVRGESELKKSELEMKGNSKITGNKASNGGGVYVDYFGNFTMSDDAAVSGNTASSAATLSASSDGGGVYVDDFGNFTMSGNAEVSGNTASSTSAYGGGVYVSKSGASFTKTGGIIYGSNETDTSLRNVVTGSNHKGAAVYLDSTHLRNTTVSAEQDLSTSGLTNKWWTDN
jgi:hypothetical protein